MVAACGYDDVERSNDFSRLMTSIEMWELLLSMTNRMGLSLVARVCLTKCLMVIMKFSSVIYPERCTTPIIPSGAPLGL